MSLPLTINGLGARAPNAVSRHQQRARRRTLDLHHPATPRSPHQQRAYLVTRSVISPPNRMVSPNVGDEEEENTRRRLGLGASGDFHPHLSNVSAKPSGGGSGSTYATETKWEESAQIFEYGSAANPVMAPIPVLVHPPEMHEEGPTRVIPFDIDDFMDIDKQCTSPNLMASFVRVCEGDSIDTTANATSQAFYVIRGTGQTSSEHGTVSWSTGDLFVVPATRGALSHLCASATKGGAALYWVHDEPLMDYLGVVPSGTKFEPTLFKRERMLAEVQEIAHQNTKGDRNRLGILLGNKACEQTKTLTHVLWSLLNSIPAQSVQRPHRHNSVALDLAVSASPNVYTLMGKEIDWQGNIIDPIRCDWVPGGVFVTPPGWWHSHHNESDELAWVLPMQDAGLYTHQRTLDIRFVDDELELYKEGKIRGSSFAVTNRQYTEMVGFPSRDSLMALPQLLVPFVCPCRVI
jgi:gentisate 1,2-dioxygenase